jgi:putative ABC transport system substrate-binding protein
MRRRAFFALLGGVVAWPVEVRAQQKRVPVIGFLGARSEGESVAPLAAFRQGLSDAGYVEGQNVAIEYRWAEGIYDRLPALAAEFVDRNVDLIAAQSDNSALAAKRATSTIPIVLVAGDPVADGLVANLARPGGNLTGISILTIELHPKRLELLSELVPQARVIALLMNPKNANADPVRQDVQKAARAKGVELHIVMAATINEIEAAFADIVKRQAGGVVVASDPFFSTRREQLVALAARHAVPAIYQRREFVEEGGLISYGSKLAAAYRQAGIYGAKILKGTKPADLPVQQPATLELVVNLKTAQALGLTLPQSLLMRADQITE